MGLVHHNVDCMQVCIPFFQFNLLCFVFSFDSLVCLAVYVLTDFDWHLNFQCINVTVIYAVNCS